MENRYRKRRVEVLRESLALYMILPDETKQTQVIGDKLFVGPAVEYLGECTSIINRAPWLSLMEHTQPLMAIHERGVVSVIYKNESRSGGGNHERIQMQDPAGSHDPLFSSHGNDDPFCSGHPGPGKGRHGRGGKTTGAVQAVERLQTDGSERQFQGRSCPKNGLDRECGQSPCPEPAACRQIVQLTDWTVTNGTSGIRRYHRAVGINKVGFH